MPPRELMQVAAAPKREIRKAIQYVEGGYLLHRQVTVVRIDEDGVAAELTASERVGFLPYLRPMTLDSDTPTKRTPVPAVRGEEFYVVGLPIHEVNQGQVTSRCLSPVKLGPGNYPEMIHVIFSEEGCREQFNLDQRGSLRLQIRDKLSDIKVLVSFSNGTPAYNAEVDIFGFSHGLSFGGAVLTDKSGG